MSSTPSTLLRLELQARGENRNAWGAPKLNDMVSRMEEAVADNVTIALSGTTRTLSSDNYVANESRAASLTFTGAPGGAVTVTTPNTDKLYLVDNQTNQSISFVRSSGGASAAVRAGFKTWVWCDGTRYYVLDPTLDTVKAPAADVSLNGKKITNLATPISATDATNKAYVDAITLLAAASAAEAQEHAQDASDSADAAAISQANSASFATSSSGFATASANSATDAANSAVLASTNAATLRGTSTTSVAIGTDPAVFTTQSGKQFNGEFVLATDAANNANFIYGLCTYSGTTASISSLLTGGTGTKSNWVLSVSGARGPQGPSGTPSVPYSARTGAFSPAAADKGTYFEVTSGTFSVTPVASATLAAGWYCYLRNSGTGNVTFDPNSTETVDGASTLVLGPGQEYMLVSDGSNFHSFNRPRGFSPGTVLTAPGASAIFNNIDTDEVMISFNALTTSGGAGNMSGIQIAMSTDNGSTWSSNVGFGPTSLNGTQPKTGVLHITGLRNGRGVMLGVYSNFTAPYISTGDTARANLTFNMGAKVNAIRFTDTGGYNFNAGTFTMDYK